MKQEEPESSTAPYLVGNGVTPPLILSKPLPRYTKEARKAKIQGLLLLKAVFRKNGTVDSFQVVRGLGYGLDQSAINTISSRWRFKPGILSGVPVDVQAIVEVLFLLWGDYPLGAQIVQTRWERNPSGRVVGSGYGNLEEYDRHSLRGFAYTCSCEESFTESQGPRSYPAKWKEPESRLVIRIPQIGNTSKHHDCELNVTTTNVLYEVKEGHIDSYTREQWDKMHDMPKTTEP